MSATILVGVQWGDEGKGKIIDVLTRDVDMVVRFQGGNNAGHTVEFERQKFVLHLVPSGVFRDGVRCVIGNGLVVNPTALMEEMRDLTNRGVSIDGLLLSDKAHLILPYHMLSDALKEKIREAGKKIGTTKRGIGPAYADKASRCGIRALEMLDIAQFENLFRGEAEKYNELFVANGIETIDIDAEWDRLAVAAEFLRPFVTDTVPIVNAAAKNGEKILFEGAQGALLDIDHGTYPYVTSSNTTSGGACTGSGLPPRRVDSVIGVLKAYTTRVGAGPFPTELDNHEGEALRRVGNEFGATTGRPRRCGWFDAVASKYACMINGVDKLAITKLDVLDQCETLQVCVAYEIDGTTVETFPSSVDALERAKPVYESVEGWKSDTSDVRSFAELPEKARSYLRRLADMVAADLDIISVGPNRDQTFRV